ncbi:MAG: N-acetylmuramoyl-L-alanine amidase [Bacteroidetes bacterium]|nr:MAG: N-acetylmuramoyl-L-alanine amidase [Bacteroidota bacterium]
MKIILLLSFILFNIFAQDIYAQKKKVKSFSKVKILAIDAGHGGLDNGCSGKKIKEKTINFAVSQLLGNMIKKKYPNIKIVYTRTKDQYLSIDQRVQTAHQAKADLLISIHTNHENSRKVKGTETFIFAEGKPTRIVIETKKKGKKKKTIKIIPAAKSPKNKIALKRSEDLAKKIELEYVKQIKRNSRGVKKRPLKILRISKMPAVLTELGFLSNSEEEVYLSSKKGQEQLAKTIFTAFEQYLKGK